MSRNNICPYNTILEKGFLYVIHHNSYRTLTDYSFCQIRNSSKYILIYRDFFFNCIIFFILYFDCFSHLFLKFFCLLTPTVLKITTKTSNRLHFFINKSLFLICSMLILLINLFFQNQPRSKYQN